MTFTKEQLIARAETVLSNARTAADFHDSKPYHQIDVLLAEIALTALTADPAVTVDNGGDSLSYRRLIQSFAPGTKLYAAPPAPVVPNEIEPTVEAIKRVLPTSNPDEYAACIGADMWNACRAAMLQVAEQQDRQQNIPENIPTLRDGVAAIRNSGIAIDAGKIQAERDALNTLDVPDGWMMVPKRLTAENGAKAALIGEFNLEYSLTCHECFGEGCEDCSGEGSWTNTVPIDWSTIKHIWAKAIDHFAAAPQQEVKP